MTKAHFIVAAEDGRWVVSASDGLRQSFDVRVDAVRAAVEAAHRAGCEGSRAQVLALDEQNQFYAIWTYGRDAFLQAD
jgi:hypothetical protein